MKCWNDFGPMAQLISNGCTTLYNPTKMCVKLICFKSSVNFDVISKNKDKVFVGINWLWLAFISF